MNLDDIIDLPHFKAPGRPEMLLSKRAAQFAPYKSLGDDSIDLPPSEAQNQNQIILEEQGEI